MIAIEIKLLRHSLSTGAANPVIIFVWSRPRHLAPKNVVGNICNFLLFSFQFWISNSLPQFR